MNINYEYYHIFYYVAKYKNITRAAEFMHSNQPNVSRTIKLLEHELGCSLVLRSNRGISLTPEGDRLYSHVKIAIEQLQAAEDELTRSVGLHNGVVTLGASETALHLLLLPVLNTFKRRYPDLHIRILNHLTRQAIDSIKNGSVDFAVVTTPANIEKPLISYPIVNFKDILIGGTSYRSLSDRTFSLKELQEYPLVCLVENTMTYQFFEKFYYKNNLILKPEMEASTTDQILPMIKNNLGIGFVPEVFAADALAKKEVFQIPLKEEIPTRQICIVENERYPLSIAAKELKKMLMHVSLYS